MSDKLKFCEAREKRLQKLVEKHNKKQVNFIEAVEYAIKGKEVYCKIDNKKYYLVSMKHRKNPDFSARYITILSNFDYERYKYNEKIISDDNCTNIEFYLNKWTVKDE